MNRLIVSVDFDHTIVEGHEYPEIGTIVKYTKEVLTKWRDQGIFIQINSCRNGEAEWEMATFLFDNKIPYHIINDHASFIKQKYFNPHHPISKKNFCHINIDDTNIDWVLNGHPGWERLDKQIQQILHNNPNEWNVEENNNYNYI